ncbi:prepilin-type N-terminal cleavage/methylation domain-containing protein [Pseudoteredinibacter isoporae]|nr:prepilin-type N-terminal cleavage/methylation domain-containing protein [Pseudoteredinibacter isoporae]NIB23780.1 prepilin-type N-terminal cleavage/methylation domain-containing protein [Pseudoteredinibacter isoporae]
MNTIPSVKGQAGFTLIELVAVIVILGILSATALPRFVDLSDSAEQSALQGVAGALSSAAALNHANNLAKDAGLSTATVTDVNSCGDVVGLLEGGALPNGKYNVADTAISTAEGTSAACSVVYDSNGDGSFTGADINAAFTAYVVTN